MDSNPDKPMTAKPDKPMTAKPDKPMTAKPLSPSEHGYKVQQGLPKLGLRVWFACAMVPLTLIVGVATAMGADSLEQGGDFGVFVSCIIGCAGSIKYIIDAVCHHYDMAVGISAAQQAETVRGVMISHDVIMDKLDEMDSPRKEDA